MVQLKDDCFAFGGDLTNIEVALESISANLSNVCDIETVSLLDALGRIVAKDIKAKRNVPPYNNSAVDGYAIYFDDLEKFHETRIPITGRIAAGHPLNRPARRGEALRVFTGAPIPFGEEGGPDTIFMEEDCCRDEDFVTLPHGLERGANWRPSGEDLRKGDVILEAGHLLRAQDIGLIASVGLAEVAVFERLRVAIFSTGDEIFDPSVEAPEGCIFDSNRFSILGLLKNLGCEVTDLGILPDKEEVITNAMCSAAQDHNMIITSGGISAGEEDHVKAAVERLGNINFWRFAIKPGRPIALGKIKDAAFVGLPGNPVATIITFLMIARPLIKVLGGAIDVSVNHFQIPANFDYKKKKGRREWVRARLKIGKNRTLSADKFPAGGSGILTSMVEADGLIELEEEIEVIHKGDLISFILFSEVMR